MKVNRSLLRSWLHLPSVTTSRTANRSGIGFLSGYAVRRLFNKMAGLPPLLETLNFDNLALKKLPVDPNIEETQRQVRFISGGTY